MHSHVFLDESGDLGWNFEYPYRNGGSSRFLTICFLLSPITAIHLPRRIVRHIYNKFNFKPSGEIKASSLKSHHKTTICYETIHLLKKHPELQIGAITVRKDKVARHTYTNSNTLYNYMMGLGILEKAEQHTSCKITRDKRSIKILNGSSCIDYLQTLVWFHRANKAILKDNPIHSHTDDGIIFIDWITNMIWSRYEDNYSGWYDILSPCIQEQRLFF